MKHLFSIVLTGVILCNLFLLGGCATSASTTSSTNTTGSTPQAEKLDWTLYATKLSADGDVLDEFQFAVTGTVPGTQDMYTSQELNLNIVWPDTFRFADNGPEIYNGLASSSDTTDYFYFCRFYCPLPSAQKSIYGQFGIAPKLGYMIFVWEDEDACLVASIDPDTSPEVIKTFFASMLPDNQLE